MRQALSAVRPMADGSLPTQAICDRYIAAWSAHDPVLIAGLHSEDSSFWMHDGTERIFGREAIERHFAGIFARYPGFDFDVLRSLIGEAQAVAVRLARS